MSFLQDRVLELYKEGFRASPVLDQYFIIDEGVLRRAVQYAHITGNETVLEVGTGLGFLTRELAKTGARVITLEKDLRLKPILEKELAGLSNVEVHWQDAVKERWPGFDRLVANWPYSASAPLTFKLLDYTFKKAVVFYQKEFGKKLVSREMGEFGRISIMAQYYFDVRLEEIVPRGAFYPHPATDACIVSLVPRGVPRDREFETFVREVWRHSNKDVRNAVKLATGRDIPDDRKLFSLSVSDLRELYGKVKNAK
ncbi:16S rRNA methyltransferase [Candidatus Micrarchaeota archaeon]|nr:16S rRNA methyltransferase [Candidatus Micrarchaeota archaeon]